MKRIFFPFALAASAMLCLAGPAFSQTVTILHSFGDGTVANDGWYPVAALIQGMDGNFYGTTTYGGAATWGTVFKITPSGSVTILHSFDDGSIVDDGTDPECTLIQDAHGDFYGTTFFGGLANGDGIGTIFKITPSGLLTIVHNFSDPGLVDGSIAYDGMYPQAGLIQGKDGNFYGTTWQGGAGNEGEIFRMNPPGKVTVLHSFDTGPDNTNPTYGWNPYAGVTQGTDGNFYGTTLYGGAPTRTYGYPPGYGVVYEKALSGPLTVLHRFGDGSVVNDGIYPYAGLVQGADGNFYGTTSEGGTANHGTIFKITPSGALTVLHSFGDGSVENDGRFPYAGLVQATDGNLYGTTSFGGTVDQGTVFVVTPSGRTTILHSFTSSYNNGTAGPMASLIEDGSGQFYGTTYGGGSSNLGTVFKLTPAAMLNINPLVVAGGRTISATLNVYNPVSSKTLVRLSSSDPASASVKNTIYISAGHSTVSFSVTTQPVATNENITITAQLPTSIVPLGSVTGTFTNVSPTLASVELSANPVVGGNWLYATVNLSSAAPTEGETVQLSSVDNSYGAVTGFLSAPPGSAGSASITSITVPAGATSAQFVIATKQVPKEVNVTIRGTLNGASRGIGLTVEPPPPT